MLIFLQNDLHWSSLHIADSMQSRQHRAVTNKAGNGPSPKATSTTDSIKVNVGEDIKHRDQDRPPSATGYQASGSKLDAAKLPTPEQKRPTQPQEMPISANIPQKRAFGGDTGPPEPAKETHGINSMATRGRRTQTSSGGFFTGTDPRLNRVEDLCEENLEVEPKMLLQPETRPISHEHLVVEVKGIYAGLVMVEAKCIDIDERQSAAAQEKDPLQRTHLKNDQWQSLIALHKQV